MFDGLVLDFVASLLEFLKWVYVSFGQVSHGRSMRFKFFSGNHGFSGRVTTVKFRNFPLFFRFLLQYLDAYLNGRNFL